jgi:hypothetical protein
MNSHQTIARAMLLALSMFAGLAGAQQISGSITGMVQDPQAQVVPNARVTLINQAQGVTAMQAVTSQEGTFVFTPLLPALYTVSVEAAGFKKYSRTDISLDANQRLGLPPIALEVGSPTEAITVESNAVALETVSATRSGVHQSIPRDGILVPSRRELQREYLYQQPERHRPAHLPLLHGRVEPRWAVLYSPLAEQEPG